ncbi:MAG TPA: LysM peptidoglycan-binding domain-containing protein [Verrucomicrobiae bacterium]|nr:LysM peptidoglycan-binding domain-containing protein [Verrucomicrobiae bacterium]
MKRISFLLLLLLCFASVPASAQDAATEERFNKLAAQIEVLIEAKDAQNRRIEQLGKAIDALQQQMNKPTAAYASAEDVKALSENLKEIDRKRKADNEKILEDIRREVGTIIRSATPPSRPSTSPTTQSGGGLSDKGYEYEIQSGDTLSSVIAAYRAEGIKVSLDQVKKANPGLNENRLRVGQKIFIPAP